MVKQKNRKPITVEHEKENDFSIASTSSPSIASGVVTPTFVEHIRDLTKSALSPRKRPIMVTNTTNLVALKEVGEESSNSNSPSQTFRRSLLKSRSNLKRTSTVRRHKPSPPVSNASNSSLPLKRFRAKMKDRGSSDISPAVVPNQTTVTMPMTPSAHDEEKNFYQTIHGKSIPVNKPPTPPMHTYSPDPSIQLQEYEKFARKVSDTRDIHTPPLGTSPVMLVRRRTSARGPRGSPVRRYFWKLFRRRTRVKYHFSKEQLTRQLSFEVVASPRRPKPAKFNIKTIDMLKLHPQIRRAISRRATVKTSNPQLPIVSPRPINLARTSPSLLQFDEFEYDYRKQLGENPPDLHRSQTDRKEVSISEGVQVGMEDNPIRQPSPEVQVEIVPPRKSSRRKSAGQTVNRSNSSRKFAKFPVIRRVDVYGSNDPSELLGGEVRGSKFDEPVKIDEALDFVNTWSCYLRRAIAVRIVLRQEIHSWEVEEEKQWRRSTYSEATSINESSNSSSRSLSTATNHSYHSHQDNRSLSDNYSVSSGSVFSDIELEHETNQSPQHIQGPNRQSLRESLDDTRIASKYGSLVASNVGTSMTPPERSSSDSLTSMSKPDTESMWLSGKRTIPRPLPKLPHRISPDQKSRMVSSPTVIGLHNYVNTPSYQPTVPNSQSVPGLESSHTHNLSQHDRRVSEVILQDMHQEIHELEQRTNELQELVKKNPKAVQSPRDSLISHRSSINRSGSGGSEPKSDLKRRGANRRRPQSSILDNRRLSNTIESSWGKYDSDQSAGGSPKSGSSIGFDNHSINLHSITVE